MNSLRKLADNSKFFQFIIYVGFRVYSLLLRLVFLVLRIFPINNKKIVCMNMKGKRYGDNSMYISDELLKRNKDLDIVWLLNKDVVVDLPPEIRRVDAGSFREIFELVTAKVWIDTNTKTLGTLKRKKQLFVQTWHGSYGIKKIGLDIPEKINIFDKKIYAYNGKITDLMVTNSKQMSDIYHTAFQYDGEFIVNGSPRNDLFFDANEAIKEKVEKAFGIKGKKILLYAPTFRKDFGTDALTLDCEKLHKTLENIYGGEWVVLVRLHPNNLKSAEKFIQYNDHIINATVYSVMQELLVASDILITDYSSCMFDFATTYKPCFLYATDLEDYKDERDFYIQIDELPFPIAENNDQLEGIIRGFSQDEYNDNLNKLFAQVGLNETGHASEKAADYILDWISRN